MTRRLVLVDLLFHTGRKGGMESYVREVYSRLPADDPDLEFVGLASAELAEAGAPWFPGRLVATRIRGEDRVAWARGELLAVERAARRLGADLVHCPANFGPAFARVPVVLTVHDLLAFRHPDYVPGPYAIVLRAMIRRAVRIARRVLTVSEATRDDLARLLGVPASRVDVVPLAGSGAGPAAGVARRDDVLLAVGNRMPHKNFDGLLAALARVPEPARPRLVVTGSHGDDPLASVVERLGLGRWVELVGWVSAERLEELYAEATALVFPTLFEGFGLPTLEAMSRGCPVICSDLPVLREVAGDAARYVDPLDVGAIARAIEGVCADPVERERMARAGLERAAAFSWERTAAGTRASLLAALDG
ncbi:glycosyltransferase family 4 protein [Agromyces aurantiacus]|uniref:Glycosyltransferase family 4 protein n=1 Tax=Agromyces aurantiacus TaxID=165814 RepID=A0ABV9RAX1_9MICO|nr:glycosyltransferase family 1 protein [Agromyces aurantiacus]MBM7504175.1 glycosyltransferase involved in cell wall biosynthesis [Agromyces aurantiacus]